MWKVLGEAYLERLEEAKASEDPLEKITGVMEGVLEAVVEVIAKNNERIAQDVQEMLSPGAPDAP